MPETVEEVSKICHCNENKIKVVPRGGNRSGNFGSEDCVLIAMGKLKF